MTSEQDKPDTCGTCKWWEPWPNQDQSDPIAIGDCIKPGPFVIPKSIRIKDRRRKLYLGSNHQIDKVAASICSMIAAEIRASIEQPAPQDPIP